MNRSTGRAINTFAGGMAEGWAQGERLQDLRRRTASEERRTAILEADEKRRERAFEQEEKIRAGQVTDMENKQRMRAELQDLFSKFNIGGRDEQGNEIKPTANTMMDFAKGQIGIYSKYGALDPQQFTALTDMHNRFEKAGVDEDLVRAVFQGDSKAMDRLGKKVGVDPATMRVEPVMGRDGQPTGDYKFVGIGQSGKEFSITASTIGQTFGTGQLLRQRGEEAKIGKTTAETRAEEEKGRYYKSYSQYLDRDKPQSGKSEAAAQKEVRATIKEMWNDVEKEKDPLTQNSAINTKSRKVGEELQEELMRRNPDMSANEAFVMVMRNITALRDKSVDAKGQFDEKVFDKNIDKAFDALRKRRSGPGAPAAPARPRAAALTTEEPAVVGTNTGAAAMRRAEQSPGMAPATPSGQRNYGILTPNDIIENDLRAGVPAAAAYERDRRNRAIAREAELEEYRNRQGAFP
jgi:hypothetical protein